MAKRGRPPKKKIVKKAPKLITGKGAYKWIPDPVRVPEGHVRVRVLKAIEEYRVGQSLVIPERRFKSMSRRGEVEIWKDV